MDVQISPSSGKAGLPSGSQIGTKATLPRKAAFAIHAKAAVWSETHSLSTLLPGGLHRDGKDRHPVRALERMVALWNGPHVSEGFPLQIGQEGTQPSALEGDRMRGEDDEKFLAVVTRQEMAEGQMQVTQQENPSAFRLDAQREAIRAFAPAIGARGFR